jgi:hypothetical protein
MCLIYRKGLEANAPNVHTLSDTGIREGIQSQQVPDAQETHRDLAHTAIKRAPNQNLVSNNTNCCCCRSNVLLTNYFLSLIPSSLCRFQNRRMKFKKDSSLPSTTVDLLYADEQQITQNYPTYQQQQQQPASMPPHHDYNNGMMVANGNNSLNDLMNINHEQQQTHFELSSFV